MTIQSQSFEKIDLPTAIFIHPQGYKFFQNIENAETNEDQFKFVKEFSQTKHFDGAVNDSLVLGENQKAITDEILDKKYGEYYRRTNDSEINEETFSIECLPLILENANNNFTVWLMDEDGNNMGVRYDVSTEDIFESLCEIYRNA